MPNDPRLRDIFDQAAELPAVDRPGFLDHACAGDSTLRAEVESLLLSLEGADEFLDEPTIPPSAGQPDPSASTVQLLDEKVGAYRLIRQIGEGGMGIVYLAEQSVPVRRQVALKIIKPGLDSAAVIGRFEAERQALALMDHSNIARVFDAGATPGGRPYFVMELVQGVPLTRYCDEHLLAPDDRLALFISVCQAVQHAHQKGIIHRDLKPGNVLVMVQDGKPVVKVIDFGIAKAIDQTAVQSHEFTRIGAVIGTPEYMSPEQAGAETGQIDTRSDVYSLGVILYELLTGTTPLDRKLLFHAGHEQMMRTIREVDPPKPSTRYTSASGEFASASAVRKMQPRKLARLLSGDLDLIVMKCLEKDRARRYDTATALARDVERFLNGEPVDACPPSGLYVLGKFSRKYRRAIATVMGFMLLVLVFLIATSAVFYVMQKHATREKVAADIARVRAQNAEAIAAAARDEAVLQKQAAVKAQSSAEVESYRSSIAAASNALQADNFSEAQEFLQDAPDRLRNWEWHYLHAVVNPQSHLINANADLTDYHPDQGEVSIVMGDETVHFYEAATARETKVWTFLASKKLRPFAISADEQRIVAERPDFSLVVLDNLGNTLSFIPSQQVNRTSVYTTRFTRDHSEFITSDRNAGIVRIWKTDSGRERMRLEPKCGFIISTALSRDESRLLTGSTDGVIKIWDFKTGDLKCTYTDPGSGSIGGVFSPDGTRVIANTTDLSRQAVIFDATSATADVKLVLHAPVHYNYNMGTNYSPDGKMVAVAGGKFATVFDALDGHVITLLRGHLGRVPGVIFIGDGSHLLTNSNDGTVRFWNLHLCSRPLVFGDQHQPVVNAAFTSDGQALIAFSGNQTASVYDLNSGTLRCEVSPTTLKNARHIAPGAKSTSLISIPLQTGSIAIVDGGTGSLISTVGDQLPGSSPVCAAFMHDRTRVITGSAYGLLRVWDVATGTGIGTLSLLGSRIDRLVVSPDDSCLIAWSFGRQPVIWNLPARKKTGLLPVDIRSVSFSRDSRSILVAGNFWVKVFDRDSAAEKCSIDIVHAAIRSAAFDPTGTRIVVSMQDEVAEVWDIATQIKLHMLYGHQGCVENSRYNPDGSRIVTCAADNTARVWDAETGKQLLTLQGHTAPVVDARFSEDGTKILTLSQDGTARVWDSISPEEAMTARP